MKKALVISDQPLTVFALRSVLRQCDPDIAVEDATHLAEAITSLADRGPFQLIVLDIDMAHSRRLGGAALLRKLWSNTPLVVLSEMDADTDIVRAIDMGAVGYLVKSSETPVLVDALRLVLSGDVYVPDIHHEQADLGL